MIVLHLIDGALGALRPLIGKEVPTPADEKVTPRQLAAFDFEPWPDRCPTDDLRKVVEDHITTVALGWGVCNKSKPQLVTALGRAMVDGEAHLFDKLRQDLDSTAEFLSCLQGAVESASSRILVAAGVIGTDPRYAELAADPHAFAPADPAEGEGLPAASAA